MSKSKLIFGLALTLSAIAYSAVPAFAEFSSTATSGKAKAEGIVEGNGFTITCPAEETEWKLPKSPSPREIQIIKPTKVICTVKSKTTEEIAVEERECEGELISNSKGITKEAELLSTILTTCTTLFKISGTQCELRTEPEGNKEIVSGPVKNEGSNIVSAGESTVFFSEVGEVCPGLKGKFEAKAKAKAILENEKLEGETAKGSGPYWHVNGSRLEAGAKQVKMQLKGSIVLKSAKLGVEVECKSSGSEGATIEGNGAAQGQDKGRLSLSSCKVLKPEKECLVAEPIVTKPLKSYLAFNEGAQQNIVDVFEPTEGTTLTELKFSGKGCGILAGSQPLKGSVAASVVPKGSESQEYLFEFPATAITTIKHEGTEKTVGLTISSNPATLSAAFGARLATGEKWGVFET
jgi:hypothetical protein